MLYHIPLPFARKAPCSDFVQPVRIRLYTTNVLLFLSYVISAQTSICAIYAPETEEATLCMSCS